MRKPGGSGRAYLPGDTAPVSLRGHRLSDAMSSLVSDPSTPAEMLDLTSVYVYDSLNV